MGPRLLSSWGRGCRFVRPFVCGCESLCLDPDAPTLMPIKGMHGSNDGGIPLPCFPGNDRKSGVENCTKSIVFFPLPKYDLFSLICNLQIFRYELTTNRRETVVHLSFQTNVQHHFDLDFRYAELIYKITQYDILLSDDTPFKIHRYCRQ